MVWLRVENGVSGARFRVFKTFNVNYRSIEVEEYEGPKLDSIKSLTEEWIINTIEYIKKGKIIHKKYVLMLIEKANELFKSESNITTIRIPKDGTVTICGDLHGQYKDLLAIFKLNEYPSRKSSYVFNGDFIDRGRNSIEVIVTLLMWKCLYPKEFYLIRGNHENKHQHKLHG